MGMFSKAKRNWLRRKVNDIWCRGYAAGYYDSHKETLEMFSEAIIREMHEDAVLSMTADLDTLERIVEIIEAVRDNGKTQDD
jgi:hypothetical protein